VPYQSHGYASFVMVNARTRDPATSLRIAEMVAYPSINARSGYATWFSLKDDFSYRLPTNTEWEHIATGGGSRAYPRGNSSASGRCNICDQSCAWKWRDSSVNDGWPTTAPAALFTMCASREGVLDLIGNVAEWCSTPTQKLYDLRGGSWGSPKSLYDPVFPNLKDGEFQDATTGFRLAATVIDLAAHRRVRWPKPSALFAFRRQVKIACI
jgi:formylglycine-generating enzyme required for sulfatase activity